MKVEAAQRRIQAFERKFDQPHLSLAAHAALPLALTPDLLYRIWANFQRDLEGKPCKIPWISVSDLLLSSLCDEVGYELYEMEDTIRHQLLQKLSQNQRQQVAAFLLQYVQADLKSHDGYYREFAQSQSWAAQAYLHPEKAIELLAAAINTAYGENPDDLMRLTTLTELFAQDVPEFDKLVIYARAIGHAARNRIEKAKEEIVQLSVKEDCVDLGSDIQIPIPQELLDFLTFDQEDKPNQADEIAQILRLFETTENKFELRQAFKRLEKIGQGNAQAISALLQLIQNTNDESIRLLAIECLGKIDPGNDQAIASLIPLIQNTTKEFIRNQTTNFQNRIKRIDKNSNSENNDLKDNTNLIEETSINSNPEATLEIIDVQINLIDAAISALENRVKEVPSYLAYRGRNFDKFIRLQELKSEKRKLLKQRKEMT